MENGSKVRRVFLDKERAEVKILRQNASNALEGEHGWSRGKQGKGKD